MRSARRVSCPELEACAAFPSGSRGPGAGGCLPSPRDPTRAAVARGPRQEPVTERGAEREAAGSEVSAGRAGGPHGWARGTRGSAGALAMSPHLCPLPRARAPRFLLSLGAEGFQSSPGGLAPCLSEAGGFQGRGEEGGPRPIGSERGPGAQDSWEMRSRWWQQCPVLRVK